MPFGGDNVNKPSVGKEANIVGPKVCKCGKRAEVMDTINYEKYIRRRYRCVACESRWTTHEIVIEALTEILVQNNPIVEVEDERSVLDLTELEVDELMIQEAEANKRSRFHVSYHDNKLYIVRVK